ncbi:MAG: hypothetical protein LJE94_09375 [Deltaproteobacteria bacterium]|nr:hypothetical protein [Deltaproteobacteria bacterium]
MPDNKRTIQLVWGVLLLLMGIGVFYRIPQVMPDIEKIEQFSSMTVYIRFCFYLIGVLLIGGGCKKVYTHLKSQKRQP